MLSLRMSSHSTNEIVCMIRDTESQSKATLPQPPPPPPSLSLSLSLSLSISVMFTESSCDARPHSSCLSHHSCSKSTSIYFTAEGIYVYIYIYMYVYIYMYLHVSTCTPISTCTCTPVGMGVFGGFIALAQLVTGGF